ncbi:aminotransferase class IV [Pigmentiphaga sp. GD03639]|uniref:aminotransferase class IV n=1 Tax=unclassified Pigmentiphaga TaxID=2626614 RepID=UPI000B40EC4C|nr:MULTISPECIES: aminotransferase class IV [unclassified Pigmentiphaga]MDH2239533.1 aminotransferase class IV [Pigmentiphaga sp. GD03639]OVZ65237.1 aminotransferase [Pigmentiphaga sp. NML030171]
MRPQLIETIRVEDDGRMPLLPWHLERLGASCSELAYHWSVDAVQRAIARAAAGLPEGVGHRMRVLVADNGSVEVETSALPPLPPRPRVALAPERLDSGTALLRHKTTWRPWYESAAAWLAGHPDHFDLLYLNERDELCEGSRTNVHLLLDGRWVTPPVSCGLLPGVQRAALLDEEKVEEAVVTRADLGRAQGLRLSNALRGWFDVILD